MDFKTANRTPEQRAAKKRDLDELFVAACKGKNGQLNRAGMREIGRRRWELAELIVELVEDEVRVTDPLPFLVDRKTQGFTDQRIIREHQGTLKVTKRSYGTKPLSQRLTATERSLTTSHSEIAVELPLEEIASGATTPSMVIEAMALAITRRRVAMVLDALDAAIPASADRTGVSGYTLRYTGFTSANVAKAIDGMRDDGMEPTIFGRHIALYPELRGFVGSEEGKFQQEERGVVGRFLGAPVVSLIEKFDKRLGAQLIRKDRIWLAGDTKGATLYDVDVSFLNWSLLDERTATFGAGIRLQDGVDVHNPYVYRVIEK